MKYIFAHILLFLAFHSSANHIAAGEMYYDYLGNNDYRINVLIYRDSAGTQYDDPLHLTVFNQFNAALQVVSIPFDASTVQIVDYSTLVAPACLAQYIGPYLEYYTYSAVVNLPPINGGYTLSYQRCCLSAQLINVAAPTSYGYTFSCKIPGLETGQYENSSPRFLGHSLFLACTNQLVSFNHPASDPDGDSLVYSLITPIGFDQGFTDPNPYTEYPPPYPDLLYDISFNAQEPIGQGATLSIDSMTGTMTIQPVLIGQFAIGVKVDEYKSATLINSTYRNLNMLVIAGTAEISHSHLSTKFSVSPNPASNHVHVHSDLEHTLTVFSAEGKEIIRFNTHSEGSYSVDLSLFESGVYYFEFVTVDGITIKKVVK